MTTVCLIRHGETDWNSIGMLQGRKDIPLNEAGILHAKQCRQVLTSSHCDVVITSPLKRAKQTATIINEKLNVPVIEMVDFVERDFGLAEGMTYDERNSKFPNRSYPNQEERISFHKRVMEGLNTINHRYVDNKILLVAHGGVINAILAELSNGEIGSEKTDLLNGCMSNIFMQDGKWFIKDYNQISHLSIIK
ncbi:MAG: histidine phosphatase family protein [Firmicutes bacterium]|nr:histidine phosphatase family protein [Bacillota bacterium]